MHYRFQEGIFRYRLLHPAAAESMGEARHMGVLIAISEATPGVMVAADGREASLVSAEA
jgi:hypothetical protein